jgi:hypothetical protein
VKDVRLTHIGGRTLLIEAAGWQLLTDPTIRTTARSLRFALTAESRAP